MTRFRDNDGLKSIVSIALRSNICIFSEPHAVTLIVYTSRHSNIKANISPVRKSTKSSKSDVLRWRQSSQYLLLHPPIFSLRLPFPSSDHPLLLTPQLWYVQISLISLHCCQCPRCKLHHRRRFLHNCK